MEKDIPNKRFNKRNPGADFSAAREMIDKWNAVISLNPEPELPATLLKDPRIADNSED
jgi:hypothetical protein